MQRERVVLETLELCPDLYLNFELRTYVVNNLPRLGPEIKSLERKLNHSQLEWKNTQLF